MRKSLALLFALALSACGGSTEPTITVDERPLVQDNLVLTSVGPIYSLTKALLEDTSVEVKNLPESARSLAAQPTWFSRQSEPFYEDFTKANAVITLGNIWPQDPLYLSVREQNISVVNIDATLPFSSQLTGISLIQRQSSDAISPYFWTSLANLIRSAKIVSADLARLFPNEAEQIRANEQDLSNELLAAKVSFEQKLTEQDLFFYALADEFSYLTNEFGIFVADYFIKQDIDWTPDDRSALTANLKSLGQPIVIHKWEASEEIQQAILDAGSRLIILDTYETSTEDILSIATANLDKILSALSNTQ